MVKAIFNISIWILFLKGAIASIVGCVMTGKAIMGGNIPSIVYPAVSIVGVAALLFACVALKLKKSAQ